MAEKKKSRQGPPRRTRKTPVPTARRRLTRDKPSAEKLTEETQPSGTLRPTQSKFVQHKESKSKLVETPTDSKPLNETQKACRMWFDGISKTGLRGIRKDFIEVVKKYASADMSTKSFNDESNTAKNRYDDVGLLDETRVKIRLNAENDDYIHASFVRVHPDLTYICTQGPLTNTVQQFWLMCIQEEVKVILQLCQNVEDGREKCCDYLPKDEEWVAFGPVQVKIVEAAVGVPGTKKVQKTVIRCKFEDKELTLTHILYSGWPDHGPPESVPTCRELRNLVHKLYDKKPIVLHCSAGIGRTGSFVAIEMVCYKLLIEHKGDFSMVQLMQDLRNQRALAVQNDQQYCFIFRCVIDILIAEDGLSKTSEVMQFIQSYENMLNRKRKPRGSKSSRKRPEPPADQS